MRQQLARKEQSNLLRLVNKL